MSLIIESVPQDCMHCGNEIAVVIRTTLPNSTANREILLWLTVELSFNSGVFDTLIQQRLKPDTNGRCRFVIDRFLWDSFQNQFDIPAAGGSSSYEPQHVVRRYKMVAIEYSGNPQTLTDLVNSGSITQTRYAVFGAIAESRFAVRNFFGSGGWNLLAPSLGGLGYAFLDWRGEKPRTRLDEDQWLHYIYQDPFGIGGAILDYKVEWFRSDGASGTIDVLSTPAMDIYDVIGLPAGFEQLGLAAQETANDKILYYTTWLQVEILGSPVIVSEVKTWYVERDYYEFTQQLQYINSLGVSETLTLRGAPVQEFDVNKERVQAYRDSSYHATVGESIVFDTLVDNGWTTASGALTAQESKQFTDLVASRKVTLLSTNAGMQNMPVKVKGKTKLDPLKNLHVYQLEITQDFEDKVPDLM